jgi:hypothetical protein
LLTAGLVLLLALVAAACGGSSSPTPTPSPSASTMSAAQQVKADWLKFFAGTTPAATKISLLQNGQQFAKTIAAQASSAIAQSTQAQVSAVTITSPTTARVSYSILLGGQPALSGQTGQAVLVGGIWKVGAPSFQALLTLEKQSGGASPSPSATQ